MYSRFYLLQALFGLVLGALIACSPTKFGQSQTSQDICSAATDASVTSCQGQTQSVEITQNFKIGAGKVDILFVSDNSASMSNIQKELAARFAGFLQNLDSRSIDYRIAITTTDLNTVKQKKLITFSNGRNFLTNADSNRNQLFNAGIVRSETRTCEDFIISMYNTYGTYFQSHIDYARLYPTLCPSSDTRGIYTARLVVAENSSSFMRNDASLNVIAISNDNVRQGQSKEEFDTAGSFENMMKQNYPNKYWDFNSIVVKDTSCQQQQTLKNALGQVVQNPYGPAISGGLGTEYANLSNATALDIENKNRPRGQYLDICESSYAGHFDSMATQISEEARMVNLKCTPSSQPVVKEVISGQSVPFTWNSNKIIFIKGHEGKQVNVSYTCYTGVK